MRIVAAWPLLGPPVWPAWDEAGYVARGAGFSQLYQALLHGGPLPADEIEAAYGSGVWPPLHAMLVGLVFALLGPSLSAARWLPLLLSAGTTLLVLRYARRLVEPRGAVAAALLHALYPAFVGFSHLLWSETLFIALLIAAVAAALGVETAASARQRLLGALGAGACLGLAGLTRAAILPFLLLVPAWIALRGGRGRSRWGLALVSLATALLLLAPYLAYLHHREGRLVLLSTTNGYNLLLGQTPAPGPGSTRRAQKEQLNQRLRERSRETGQSRDEAARDLALEEIRREPGAMLLRATERAGQLLEADDHLLRHRFQAVEPPGSQAAAVASWLWLHFAFYLLLALILLGLAGPGLRAAHKALLLALVAAGAAPTLFTVASARMALPLLALLLPAAGAALAALRRPPKLAQLIAVLLALLALETWRGWQVRGSSSYYAPARETLRQLLGIDDRARGTVPLVGDRLALRARSAECHEFEVTAANSETLLPGTGAAIPWSPGQGDTLILDLYLREGRGRPGLVLRCRGPEAARSVTLDFVVAGSWRVWQPTGMPGVEQLWIGGAEISPSPLDPDWPVPMPLAETRAVQPDSGSSATRMRASLPRETED